MIDIKGTCVSYKFIKIELNAFIDLLHEKLFLNRHIYNIKKL